MKKVFISYSTQDKSAALRVKERLEYHCVNCWMATHDIRGGANYTKEIMDAICECPVFVLICSRSAQKSQYVFREVEQAVKRKKKIIPFMLEETQMIPEFEFLLSACQNVNAFENREEAEKQLVSDVIKHLPAGSDAFHQEMVSYADKDPMQQGVRLRYINCKRCKSDCLKDSISLMDYLVENKETTRKFCICVLYPPLIILTFFMLMLLKNNWMLRIFERFSAYIEGAVENTALAMGIRIAGLVILIAAFIYAVCGLLTIIAEIVRRSVYARRRFNGYDVHTFRCCDCNKKFRMVIPEKKRDLYRIGEYIEPERPEKLELFLDDLTEKSILEWYASRNSEEDASIPIFSYNERK